MATKPTPGADAGTWGAELNEFLEVALNADGTLKSSGGGGGGSGAPGQADYLFTTDGTTITRYDRTGAVSATGTNLGALVNGVAANFIFLAFAAGVFPWTTTMNLDGFIGLTMIGAGGLQDENKNTMGGRGTTQFKWTAASGQAFTAEGTQGLTVKNIAFQWSSGTYTSGDATEDAVSFMTIEGVDHGTPTRHAMFENCYFGAVSGGKLDSGGPILDLNKTVNLAFRSCLFVGGTMNIRSHHTIADDDFANVVEFTACRFSRNKSTLWPSVRGSGQSWAFRNCHWEPGQSGGVIWVLDTQVEAWFGLNFEDCWFGDLGNAVGPLGYIHFRGNCLRVTGGFAQLGNDYNLVYINGATEGVYVSGIHAAGVGATSCIVNCDDNSASNIVIEAVGDYPAFNTPMVSGSVTRPPLIDLPPYAGVTANTTLLQEDHRRTIGVNATGGAVTITLPAVTCVGCELTVKKIDASANSVTVQRAGSATIDGSTTYALAAQYKFVRMISNGSNWMIAGSN